MKHFFINSQSEKRIKLLHGLLFRTPVVDVNDHKVHFSNWLPFLVKMWFVRLPGLQKIFNI